MRRHEKTENCGDLKFALATEMMPRSKTSAAAAANVRGGPFNVATAGWRARSVTHSLVRWRGFALADDEWLPVRRRRERH